MAPSAEAHTQMATSSRRFISSTRCVARAGVLACGLRRMRAARRYGNAHVARCGQLSGHVEVIRAIAFNTTRHQVLTSDSTTLRLWYASEHVKRSTLPRRRRLLPSCSRLVCACQVPAQRDQARVPSTTWALAQLHQVVVLQRSQRRVHCGVRWHPGAGRTRQRRLREGVPRRAGRAALLPCPQRRRAVLHIQYSPAGARHSRSRPADEAVELPGGRPHQRAAGVRAGDAPARGHAAAPRVCRGGARPAGGCIHGRSGAVAAAADGAAGDGVAADNRRREHHVAGVPRRRDHGARVLHRPPRGVEHLGWRRAEERRGRGARRSRRCRHRRRRRLLLLHQRRRLRGQ